MTDLATEIQNIYVTTCDGQYLQADEVKIEGEGVSSFPQAARRAGMINLPKTQDCASRENAFFHANLN